MSDLTEDSVAFEILEQLADHIYGHELEEKDLVAINKLFVSRGGSWFNIVYGSKDDFSILEDCLNQYLNYVSILKVALRIVKDEKQVPA